MRAADTLRAAIEAALKELDLPLPDKLVVEPPREARHGDLSTNAAMLLARAAKRNPRELGEALAGRLAALCPDIERVEVAGPGFCNVTFRPEFWRRAVTEVEAQGDAYGRSDAGKGRKVLVEFVSANPTGPLHVGHGRGAAVGDTLARLLKATGHDVGREYYLNDAGRQMRLLGLSVWLRLQELAERPVTFPEDWYRGDYIRELAAELLRKEPELADAPEDEARARCGAYAVERLLAGIKEDLADFRVEFGEGDYFSEKSLVDKSAVDAAFAALKEAGYTYEKDGALWFATTRLGDDKDRVLRKSDGSLTYFASDIAYHHDKYSRGYQWLVDVWGADHHGYIPRMRAAVAAMGEPEASFDVVLIQLVNLLRDGKLVSMSTRAGEFVTLREVLDEVGPDAARFLFLSRKSDSPLDFDLELAKQRNLDNPVYYVQYAHARINSLLKRAADKGYSVPERMDEAALAPLDTPEDLALLRKIAAFEDTVAQAAEHLAPQHLSRYLMELAGLLHGYYAKHQILLPDDRPRAAARIALLRAIQQTLGNGLALLGVSAPTDM
ncbi:MULTISPECIES: arginine--tRNA ligase [unclassified Desulfovibrio]|uniref:arginine--tRNA ligase n=1 Tax=unclassified Desulfovibrio TaxID=2593640 RepID=UPI0013EA998E|nr:MULTISPECIES: arginine--tRNA ligase [unclassified Desulfovibrio]